MTGANMDEQPPPRADEVVRAWRDHVFRASLSDEELARLPASPVGVLDADDLPED
ncbi:mersacidin/lichenicidin family type 2 lantibiotic [Micromonospora sp. NPDC093277]|uniref:mersacidin/lichenicidin family type 2 lantibiotic n=1 Tax=Micromonospora sp. NPDC093277 TaxID=3364291 RepID=UPI00380ACCC8